MWRLVLTVSLLCWGCEGAVTCKNNNNGAVDWYILYKAPTLQSLTGLEYLYIDSTGMTTMLPSAPNYKSIKDPSGILANTLRPLFTSIRSMQANFGFISYSDQPPGSNAASKFGHSKGVLMIDKLGTGVWLLHSTPQFPFRRNQNEFWPDSGAKNAQTFICVTFPYTEFRNIGKHLQYIRAFPFEHDLPGDFHQELRDAVNWKFIPPPNNFQLLTSNSNNLFYSIAKQKGPLPGGDLYTTIAQLVSSNLYVQTWGCQVDRSPSYCPGNQRELYNIEEIMSNLGIWKYTSDHSKWCVAENQNNHWICIADVNRAPTQYERRGGALCINNKAVKDEFMLFVRRFEACPSTTPNTMDISDCDTDISMD
ncbi:plancitoxin-1-like [Symphorus nematophorus]